MSENGNPEVQLASLLVRTMALLCVRNTALENIHAGRVPVTRTGDYSDVTVIDADGQRIPWPKVSHFDDDAMRDLMREIVDKLYTFQVRSREPGFVDRLGIWMKGASRWDEPRIDDAFLPGSPVGEGVMTGPWAGMPGCRFAFAPHPEPADEILYRIHVFLEDTDGSHWWVGTDLVTHDLESGEILAGDLNAGLGLDVAACAAFAERALAANPTGERPLKFLE